MKSSIQAKIDEKRAELEELRKIQKFTGTLATQLEEVEEKLFTMNEGAESVALVLSYWKDVTTSVNSASLQLAGLANKANQEDDKLPAKLVRIPWQSDSGSGDESSKN